VLRVVVEQVSEDWVGGYRDSDNKLVAGVAALVALRFAYEQTDLLRRFVDNKVACLATGASFCAAEKSVIDANC
jgi:hypothetical protein